MTVGEGRLSKAEFWGITGISSQKTQFRLA